jgi:hypothetical protein
MTTRTRQCDIGVRERTHVLHRNRLLLALMLVTIGATACTAASAQSFDEVGTVRLSGASYSDIRKNQYIGSVVSAPNGRFFLYEWSRPYTWQPPAGDLPAEVHLRLHT